MRNSILQVRPGRVNGNRTGAQVRGAPRVRGGGALTVRGESAIAIDEVAKHEDDAFLPDAAVEEADGFAEIGAFSFGLDGKQVSDDIKDVFLAFLGRDILFYPVAEEDGAHFVIVVDGGEGHHGADLGDDIFFPGMGCAEEGACADIDQEHDRQFPLFFKELAEGMVEACRDIPVDEPDVVSRGILTYFTEAHPTAFECAVVFACKKMTSEPFAFDLKLFHLFEYFCSCEHEAMGWE